MPDLATLIPFVIASAILVAIPGPAVLYIVSTGIGRGRRMAVASALGIETGGLVHVLAAGAGLSAILTRSAVAYSVVKYLGALYLIYLGIKTLRSPDEVDRVDIGASGLSWGQAYRRGVLVNAFNPKVALFFLAFLPQFVVPSQGGVAFQIIGLGLLFIVIATAIDMTYALASGSIGRLLRRSPRLTKGRRLVSGVTYLALGASAAVTESA